MKQINENEFKQEVLDEPKLTVVDFYADWCGPCQMLKPVLEKISEKYNNLKIVKVNVDDNHHLCEVYGIYSIPHVIMFKDGKVIDQFVGFKSENDVEEKIKAHI